MFPMENAELRWLLLTVIWTGLLWIPYIAYLIVKHGPVEAIYDPTGEHPLDAPWAARSKRAHMNSVENLVLFAPLALMVHALHAGTPATATACAVYFFARVAHTLIYTAALPVVRTVTFLIGWGALGVLVLRLLAIV